MPDNSETQEHACTSDEQRLSPKLAEWGALLDGIRLIIAQGPDGERLSNLVPKERNWAFLHRNKYAEAFKAFEHAVSKLTEWAAQGLIESEGFHEDTGTRSSVTQREWQSRVIKIWENRLINPLRGITKTYPWITDIEIDLEKVKALASSKQTIANTEPNSGDSNELSDDYIDRCIRCYIMKCADNGWYPVPEKGKFEHGCDTIIEEMTGKRYAGRDRRWLRDRFYKNLKELGIFRKSGRPTKANILKLNEAKNIWAYILVE
jgi:hypothetical protein